MTTSVMAVASVRLGMRYLDQIAVHELSASRDLLHSGLLGLVDVMPGNFHHTYSETVSVVEGLTLVLKSFVSPAGLVLPPDLGGMALSLSEEITSNHSPQVVMDSDCFVEKRFTFELAAIETYLDSLHSQLLTVFKAATTEQARQLWQI